MHAPSTQPRRSDATRARILAAAQDRFAREGLERTTVRAVAADAGIDPSMVMRYFGSKDGLFAAASAVDLRLPDLSATPKEQIGFRLMEHFLNRWEGDLALQALLRTSVSNEAVAAKAREVFTSQILPLVQEVCPAEEAHGRAALISSQVLGLALCRYVLRLPGAVELSREEIVARVGPTLQRYLMA